MTGCVDSTRVAPIWLRGRAWALWKALIVAAGMTVTNAPESAEPMRVIRAVLDAR